MLHWLKQLRVSNENCTDLESRITFLEQQLNEYRCRLEEAEKAQGFIANAIAQMEAPIADLFKQVGAARDAAHHIWSSAATLNTLVARIQEAQASCAESTQAESVAS